MKKTSFCHIAMLLTLAFLVLAPAKIAKAEYMKVILIVGDRSNTELTQKEEALKKYLVYYRQKYGHNSRTLPILVYDYSYPQVRNYCQTKLGIYKEDLLFLGIATARGKLPEKIHTKITNPQDLDKNAQLMVQQASGASGSTGSVKISSDPEGAKVWLNKEFKGRTPLTISGMSEGTYTLTFIKDNYVKTRKEITIKKGEVSSLKVSLPSSSGALVLTSNPSGAKVYVDGTYYGETPLRLRSVLPGRHKILMTRGSLKWEKTIQVATGKTTTLNAEMAEVAVNTPIPTPTFTIPTPIFTEEPTPVETEDPSEVQEAFIPRSEQNIIFRVSVTNLEEVSSIKDYYKPKPGYKFVVAYLSQQNISDEVQIYTGQFSLLDQGNTSYEYIENLSNFWLVVLRPGGMNIGYLIFEIPQDAKAMALVLHGLNMAPLSVSLK